MEKSCLDGLKDSFDALSGLCSKDEFECAPVKISVIDENDIRIQPKDQEEKLFKTVHDAIKYLIAYILEPYWLDSTFVPMYHREEN